MRTKHCRQLPIRVFKYRDVLRAYSGADQCRASGIVVRLANRFRDLREQAAPGASSADRVEFRLGYHSCSPNVVIENFHRVRIVKIEYTVPLRKGFEEHGLTDRNLRRVPVAVIFLDAANHWLPSDHFPDQ